MATSWVVGAAHFFLTVDQNGFQAEDPEVYFTGAHCVGQAYLVAPARRTGLRSMSGISYGVGPGPGDDYFLYRSDLSGPGRNVAVLSKFSTMGNSDFSHPDNCQPVSGADDLVNASAVINVTSELPPSYTADTSARIASGTIAAGTTALLDVDTGTGVSSEQRQANGIGEAVERALVRYLADKEIQPNANGQLAALISAELHADAPATEPTAVAPVDTTALTSTTAHERGRPRYYAGRRLAEDEVVARGVFVEDVELRLQEDGTGPTDKVQLVFATPEFDGDPTFGDAWSIVVNAHDTASTDDGTMFFSTPSFGDALQLFTDGSAVVSELRELTLRRLSSPPISCCSGGQEGMFYWDEQANTLCVCDGSNWSPVDSDNLGTCA